VVDENESLETGTKRLHSLAYNRSLRELRNRHEYEFRTILRETTLELLLEETSRGRVERWTSSGGGLVYHWGAGVVEEFPGEVAGLCVGFGEMSTCRAERRRERERARREGKRLGDSDEMVSKQDPVE
jgi:hypothetical protein